MDISASQLMRWKYFMKVTLSGLHRDTGGNEPGAHRWRLDMFELSAWTSSWWCNFRCFMYTWFTPKKCGKPVRQQCAWNISRADVRLLTITLTFSLWQLSDIHSSIRYLYLPLPIQGAGVCGSLPAVFIRNASTSRTGYLSITGLHISCCSMFQK